MTGPDAPGTPATPPRKRRGSVLRRENRRLLAGLVLGALVAVFAVLNVDEVDVNWIFGTWETPLIIVIAATFALGAVAGWIAGASRRRHS